MTDGPTLPKWEAVRRIALLVDAQVGTSGYETVVFVVVDVRI